MSAAVRVVRAPSWRVVQIAHDPTVTAAASWERLAVWCALRDLPAPTPATRVRWVDHDPAEVGAERLVAVGCAVGPGVASAPDGAEILDTPSVWCATVAAPAGPRELAEQWTEPGATLRGIRHWWLGPQCYWPVTLET